MFSLTKSNTQSLEETIDALIAQHEQLKKEAQELFEEMGMTSEQVDEALNDPTRFDAETLRQLEKERERQDQLFPSIFQAETAWLPHKTRRAMRQAANWIPMR